MKLSERQAEAMELLDDGWSITTSQIPGFFGPHFLKIGHYGCRPLNTNTFTSLYKKGLIELDKGRSDWKTSIWVKK